MTNLGALFLCFALGAGLAQGSQNSASSVRAEKHTVPVDFLGKLLFQTDAVSTVMCAAVCKATPSCRFLVLSAGTPTSSSCRGYASPPPTTTTTTTTTTTITDNNNNNNSNNNNIVNSPSIAVWTLQVSAWLEKPCVNDSECGGAPLRECFAHTCVCAPGYYYSLTRDSCVETCDQPQLRTQVLAYPGKRVMGLNIGSERFTTLNRCLELCALTPDARTCDFLAYTPVHICSVQSVTKLDIEDEKWMEDPETTHYQKTCV